MYVFNHMILQSLFYVEMFSTKAARECFFLAMSNGEELTFLDAR